MRQRNFEHLGGEDGVAHAPFAAPRARSSRARQSATGIVARFGMAFLVLFSCTLAVGLPARPVLAGDDGADFRREQDEQRRQRDEERRQRDEERRQRDEQRRQRDEERREREEARREREEQRRERETARQARDEARAAQEAERREREQERAAREAAIADQRARAEQERAERERANRDRADADRADRDRGDRERPDRDRDGGSGDRREPDVLARTPPVVTPTAERAQTSDDDAPVKSWRERESDTERDRGKDTARADRDHDGRERETSRREDNGKATRDNGRETSSTRATAGTASKDGERGTKDTRKTKDGEKDDDDSQTRKADDGDVAEPVDEPPRTFVEWWNRITNNGTNKSTDSGASQTASRDAGVRTDSFVTTTSSTSKPATTTVSTTTATSTTITTATGSKTTDKKAPTTSGATSSTYNGVKIRARDDDLFNLGQFRKREIMASGLTDQMASKAADMGFKTIATVMTPGFDEPVRTLSVPSGVSEDAAQKRLAEAIPGGHFGPNHVYRIVPASESSGARPAPTLPGADASPNPSTSSCSAAACFARDLINWQPHTASCAAGVRIGIIDTSFDLTHPSLKGRNVTPRDFRARAVSLDQDWHGTAVFSVLAGDPQSATPGLVPGATFLLASTFGADAKGQATADAMSVLAALAWLDGQVDVVNMSFSGPRNEEIELAIGAMAAKGVIFVAAAGNNGPNGPASFPAAYPQVIAVTAISRARSSYRHATHGSYIDLSAPGVDIYTALPKAQAGLRTGTSFAAPFVTSLIAAMPAARRGIRSKSDLLARISMADLGEPGRDPLYGEGLPVAPSACEEIGGLAALPWTEEARRQAAGGTGGASTPVARTSAISGEGSAMTQALGFAP